MKIDSFYNGLNTPYKKKKNIPEITYSYGIDTQAYQLAKMFYQSQKYFITKCNHRSQLSFLYQSTFNFWCPENIKKNPNLHRHFSQVLYALSKSLKVINVIKGKKIIHNKLPTKNEIVLCKYILKMKNYNLSPKYVWIPTKIVSIDRMGNAQISFINNYTQQNVFRNNVFRHSEYLKEWKWKSKKWTPFNKDPRKKY